MMVQIEAVDAYDEEDGECIQFIQILSEYYDADDVFSGKENLRPRYVAINVLFRDDYERLKEVARRLGWEED